MGELSELFEGVRFRQLASGTAIAEGALVGTGTTLGRSITIYPGVTLGQDCVVLDGAVIGRIPISNGSTSRPVKAEFGSVSMGDGCIVGANAVIYTDTHLGARVLIGDLASLREGCSIGPGVVIGRGVMALYACKVGKFSRIQDQVHLVGNMVVEEHVFIGMGVMTTNDNDVYLTRFGMGATGQLPPSIRRYAVIGAGATILPDLEIGEGALVGAGAVVTHDVPPWTVVSGVPARVLRPVPEDWRRQVLEGVEARERSSAPNAGLLV